MFAGAGDGVRFGFGDSVNVGVGDGGGVGVGVGVKMSKAMSRRWSRVPGLVGDGASVVTASAPGSVAGTATGRTACDGLAADASPRSSQKVSRQRPILKPSMLYAIQRNKS